MGEDGIFWFEEPGEKFEGTVFNDQTIILHSKPNHSDLSQRVSSSTNPTVKGQLDNGETVELELDQVRGIRRNQESTVLEMTTN